MRLVSLSALAVGDLGTSQNKSYTLQLTGFVLGIPEFRTNGGLQGSKGSRWGRVVHPSYPTHVYFVIHLFQQFSSQIKCALYLFERKLYCIWKQHVIHEPFIIVGPLMHTSPSWFGPSNSPVWTSITWKKWQRVDFSSLGQSAETDY